VDGDTNWGVAWIGVEGYCGEIWNYVVCFEKLREEELSI